MWYSLHSSACQCFRSMERKSLEESNVSYCVSRQALKGLDIADCCEFKEYSTCMFQAILRSRLFTYQQPFSLSELTSMTKIQRFRCRKGEQSTIILGGGLVADWRRSSYSSIVASHSAHGGK